MEQQRINEIYELAGAIHVQLSEDPRVMGPGYVSRTIQRCREADEQVNGLYTEVQQELSRLRQEHSLKELDRKVRLRAKLMSADIRSLEIAANERHAHAESALEREYQAEVRARYEQANELVPLVIMTLEQELVDVQNQIEAARTLLDVINEKKGSLNKTDSAVRLQEKAMETEVRVFGGPPNTNVGRPPRGGRPNGPITTDPTWGALTANPEAITPILPNDNGGTPRQD